jgi:hypothetical protein
MSIKKSARLGLLTLVTELDGRERKTPLFFGQMLMPKPASGKWLDSDAGRGYPRSIFI